MLPIQTTSFLGRDTEIGEVTRLLDDSNCHLLTIVGAGGIGKTRLAIQAVLSNKDKFSDGAYFIPLQSVTTLPMLVSTIANELGFHFYEKIDPKDQLLGYLHNKNILMILDSFENLLGNIEFVIDILTRSPKVQVLVTSREALNVREEWLYPVYGLNYPKSKNWRIEQYDAPQLFVERARQVNPNFSWIDEMEDIAHICQLIDGFPLAIELAATWLKSIPCRLIAEQIEHNLDFLKSSLRNVPNRHRSMRAVFEQSWNMLDTEEKLTFMKLSVFKDSCHFQAIEQVIGATLLGLSSLVDKSLIIGIKPDRYQMHELLRQYGEERLIRSKENETIRNAHSNYYLSELIQQEGNLKGQLQLTALDKIERDFDNIYTAWEWAIHQHHFDLISQASETLYWFCVSRNRLGEAAILFGNVLEHQRVSELHSERLKGQLTAYYNAVMIMSYREDSNIVAQLDKSMVIAESCDDKATVAFLLLMQGIIAFRIRQYPASILYYKQSLNLYQTLDSRFHLVQVLKHLCYSYYLQLDPEAGLEAANEGLEFARSIGDKIGVASCMYRIGGALGFLGRFDEYKLAYSETLLLHREIGNKAGIALNLGGLALIEFHAGNFVQAKILANDALSLATELNHLESKCQAMNWLGLVECFIGNYDHSRKLLESSREISTDPIKSATAEVGLALVAFGQGNYDYITTHLQNAHPYFIPQSKMYICPSVFIMALHFIVSKRERQGLKIISLLYQQPDPIVGFIKKWQKTSQIKETVKQSLGDEIYEEAWEYGKTLNLELVAGDLIKSFSPIDRTSNMQLSVGIISRDLQIANQTLIDPLTNREHEILILISQGLSNRDVAEKLVLAVSTVKRHINNCYSKLGVSSRTQAVFKAQESQLV